MKLIIFLALGFLYGFFQRIADSQNEHRSNLLKDYYYLISIYGVFPAIISILNTHYFYVFFALTIYWAIRKKFDAINHQIAALIFLSISLLIIPGIQPIDILVFGLSLTSYLLIKFLEKPTFGHVARLLRKDRYFKHLLVPLVATFIYNSPSIFLAFLGNMIGIAIGDKYPGVR